MQLVAFLLRASVRSFLANRGLQNAATLAYFGFLALMPMLLLSVCVLGQVLASSTEVEAAMAASIQSVFPTFNPELLGDITGLAGKKSWGIASLLLLAWSMTPFAGAMRGILQGIFKAENRLHILKAKIRDLAAVFALLAFFVGFVSSRVVLTALPDIPAALDWIIPLAVTTAVLAVFFKAFSPERLTWTELLAGGVAAALLLTLLRPLFGLMLQFNPGFGYAFGSLKAIFLLLVWVYYLFAAILFGAELLANIHRRESLLLRGLFSGERVAVPSLMERFVVELGAGQTLFTDGDDGAEMFHVLDGSVELKKNGLLLKTVGPGGYFGEMSLLLRSLRTASAVALVPTRLVAISERNLEVILRENPAIVLALLREMGGRLKATTEAAARKAD